MPHRRIVTHASVVVIDGDDVYKTKRPKNYGFFDYTTLSARKRFCEEEVRLNRRTAPDVYLGVVPVTRGPDGRPVFGGAGEVIDYAVHMRRLPDDRSARSLVRADKLSHDDLDRIAERAARFYAETAAFPPDPAGLAESVRENFQGARPFVGRFVPRELFDETRSLQERWLRDRSARLAKRGARDGHGDLRLEHVYLLPDGIRVIDCIEFLDRFRIADPALDAAFLAMDLRREGRADLSEAFLCRFAYHADDYDLYPLIDGYMSYRAWVRGKVACFVAADPESDAPSAERKRLEADEFFRLSRELLGPRRPCCVVGVGGLVGAGKTTLAEALSRGLSIPVVSADATRKFLAGVPRSEPAPDRAYAESFTRKVQDEILRRADEILESGRPALLDTTFANRSLRDRTRDLASRRSAPFLLVECRAPEAVLRERLGARSGGVSDAREKLLPAFLANYQPPDELAPAQLIRADTTQPVDRIVREVREHPSLAGCPDL